MSEYHFQAIQIMSLLRSNNKNVRKARDFDFNLYFPSKSAALAAADRLIGEGFRADVHSETEDRLPWHCAAKRLLVPTHQRLSDLIYMLEALAVELRGEYDGWGAFLGS